MLSRLARRVSTCALALLIAPSSAVSAFAGNATVKVAFWNVMSGKGVAALPGHLAPFTNTPNCTDPTQPLNAWGVGAMQAELTKTLSDPSVVALGVAESWSSVCGSPANIRQALGWKANTNEQNGVGLVARYGLAGPEQWQQLDTSLNTVPAGLRELGVHRLDAGLRRSLVRQRLEFVHDLRDAGVADRDVSQEHVRRPAARPGRRPEYLGRHDVGVQPGAEQHHSHLPA
jgi:hypothetical protein